MPKVAQFGGKTAQLATLFKAKSPDHRDKDQLILIVRVC